MHILSHWCRSMLLFWPVVFVSALTGLVGLDDLQHALQSRLGLPVQLPQLLPDRTRAGRVGRLPAGNTHRDQPSAGSASSNNQTCAAAKNQDTRSAGSDDKIECQDPRSTGSYDNIT